jgi:uncharacterized protein YndB with AHSA1/START domain
MPKRLLLLALAVGIGSTGCGPSRADLDHFAAAGRIDEHAPVKVHLEADIAAPPQKVWALLVNAPAWPEWEPDIAGVSVSQPLASGTRFDWKAGSNTIHSEVKFYEPGQRIIWTGKVLTAKAIHGWALAPAPGGHTHVVTDESMDGPLMATLFPAEKLSKADASWLAALKRAAEKP